MPRNQVSDDPSSTCSDGLHACALHYLQSYGNKTGNRVVIVKIDPANVVSVPNDAEASKLRCCEYKVLAEYHGGRKSDFLGSKPVMTDEEIREREQESMKARIQRHRDEHYPEGAEPCAADEEGSFVQEHEENEACLDDDERAEDDEDEFNSLPNCLIQRTSVVFDENGTTESVEVYWADGWSMVYRGPKTIKEIQRRLDNQKAQRDRDEAMNASVQRAMDALDHMTHTPAVSQSYPTTPMIDAKTSVSAPPVDSETLRQMNQGLVYDPKTGAVKIG